MVKKKEQELEKTLEESFLTSFVKTIAWSLAPAQEKEHETKLSENLSIKTIPLEKPALPTSSLVTLSKEMDMGLEIPQQKVVEGIPTYEKMSPSIMKFEELHKQEIIPSPRQAQSIKIPGLQPVQEKTIPKMPAQKLISPAPASPFEKVRPLIFNPAISSIECPGPGKNLVIHERGIAKTIAFTLTDEEISDIIKQISQKTRIPVIKGVFKAALDNFVITAIISEFVGTRFYIEKTSSPRLQMPEFNKPARF